MSKQETLEERTAFLDASLRRHGFDALADKLTCQTTRQVSDIAKFEALCRETGVDPASVKDAPPRGTGNWRQAGKL